MFGFHFFSPSYVLQAKEWVRYLAKKLRYDRDILNADQLAQLNEAIQAFKQLTHEKLLEKEGEKKLNFLVEQYHFFTQRIPHHGWRENVEIIFVALVLSLVIRAYFLQPFKIPTHSMRPTLYGIVQTPREGPKPSIWQQAYEWFRWGRSYHRLEARTSGQLISIRDKKWLGVLPISVTEVRINDDRYTLWCTTRDLHEAGYQFEAYTPVEAGEELINFTISQGDHVFVNKMVYHFRLPKRGEVFVFSTAGIEKLLKLYGVTQYYIKRCVGVGGDTLQIDPPHLKVNGHVIEGAPFERIYSMQNGYHGYVFGPLYLTSPEDTYQVAPNYFWAMGDNSPDSFDSRGWGPVTRRNLVGSAVMVYWPLSERWGWIR